MKKTLGFDSETARLAATDPPAYTRKVYPELFSDSEVETPAILDKGYIEYHLESLTSRNQEHQFEEFARRIAECEICPNLRPQTGPTGGGDSKTDSSTYPVAEELLLRAYFGTPTKATSDNWAFAFSCQKNWKSKVKSDISKIAALDRQFQKAYFISSQNIRDKDRGETEKTLSRKHGIEVHILDRKWLVGRVIDHSREDIAIETLGLSGNVKPTRRVGPRDLVRTQELEDVLSKLSRPAENYFHDYHVSADFRRAALLARNLEKPRHEVEGLFARAEELAAKVGDAKQIINTLYDHVWTRIWWYDDAGHLVSTYSTIDSLLDELIDAEDCERVVNLFTLLMGALRRGKIRVEDANLLRRSRLLGEHLARLTAEVARPNNALHAETLLWLTRIIRAWEKRRFVAELGAEEAENVIADFGVPEELTFEDACTGLRNCISRAARLPTYPLSAVVRNITRFAEFINEVIPAYDKLFERACELLAARNGESAEGELLLERGQRMLTNGLHRESLRPLGRARILLAKKESLNGSIRATLMCCDAHFQNGFFWAARIDALVAASLSLRIDDTGIVEPFLGFLAAERLCKCELALGRVAPFLSWYEWCRTLITQLDDDKFHIDRMIRLVQQYEFDFATFLLTMDQDESRELSGLVDGLNAFEMRFAASALAFACGKGETLARDYAAESGASIDEVLMYFAHCIEARPQFQQCTGGEARSRWHAKTEVMGVTYRIDTHNSFGPILFAENLLGAIEALLALAEWRNLAFICDEVVCSIDELSSGTNPPRTDDLPTAEGRFRLEFKDEMIQWMAEGHREFHEWFYKTIVSIVLSATIDPLANLLSEFEKWGDEGTFERALSASPTSPLVADLIAKEKYDVNYWYRRADSSAV